MLKIVTFLSFGLLFLIAYYYYGKIKAGRFILKKTLIGKLARKFAPDECSKEGMKIQEKINEALLDVDIIDITAIKIATLIATMILSVTVFITNSSIQTEKIYNTSTFNLTTSNISINTPIIRKQNVELIRKHLKLKEIDNNVVSLEKIKKILKHNAAISEEKIEDTANITMHDLMKIKNIYSVKKILLYLLIAVSGMWIFDLCFYLYFNIKKNKIDNEVFKLMNILTIVLSTATMPTSNIITMLIDNSYYLKGILQKFFVSYMVNSEEAYNLYLVKTGNKNFEKLIGMLKQIEDSNKEEAIRNIRNQNENQKTLERLNFENIMQKKDGIALAVLTIGVMFLIKYIMDFCMMAMNSAGSMNF